MALFGDPGGLLPSGPGGKSIATAAQIEEIGKRLGIGLRQGALGVGMGLQYTPAATRWEVLEAFRVAAGARAPVFVHVRAFGTGEPGSSVESFLEVIGAASITGAPLHIVHLNSMSLGSTPQTLRIVQEARSRGLDVTTEAYPYSAGLTLIESALLDQFENAPDSMYRKLMWVATGERLTRETFRQFRKQGGDVILFLNTPEMEAMAIESPFTAIASDGGLTDGKGHPRTAGTYARVLGYYVREKRSLTLMDALRKMALLPAQRLERVAPMFREKGRIRVGADADLAVFNAEMVTDRSTYEAPARSAVGFRSAGGEGRESGGGSVSRPAGAGARRRLTASRAVDQVRRIGNFLTRVPVSANSALATAGAAGGSPGSPTLPGGSALSTMCTSMRGASGSRSSG
jgi:N-acyl-D-aspartate/D-glutamate deacylase